MKYLELGHLNLEDPDFAIPPSFGLCAKLKEVALTVTDVCDEVWQHVCRSLLLLPRLDALSFRCVKVSAVQPSSWALPSRLTSLELIDCAMGMIPAGICCLQHLQHLNVEDDEVQLASLPRGPYLQNLLRLEMNVPKAGPEALADAVHLKHLRIYRHLGLLWTTHAFQELVPDGCKIIVN